MISQLKDAKLPEVKVWSLKNLDLTSLEKALTSLQKSIERYGRKPEDEELRDSVIQRFGTSYELCWKMLSKELQQRTPSPSQTPSLDFKSLVREESRFGLIDDPEVWFEYRRMRNITSHILWRSDCGKGSGLGKIFFQGSKIIARSTGKRMTYLHLEPRHLFMLQQLLQDFIPEARFWCFGSRDYWRGLKRF